MPATTSKRLFFALWPDSSIRRQCDELLTSLSSNRCGTAVALGNLHVTLVFLGKVDSQQEQLISQAASRLSVSNMFLTFDQLSYWHKPAIGCLIASKVDPNVTTLVEQLTYIAESCGIVVDKRPYQAHITLFRKQRSPLLAQFEAILWQAHDFCLVESCSSSSGVVYRVIDHWPKGN